MIELEVEVMRLIINYHSSTAGEKVITSSVICLGLYDRYLFAVPVCAMVIEPRGLLFARFGPLSMNLDSFKLLSMIMITTESSHDMWCHVRL